MATSEQKESQGIASFLIMGHGATNVKVKWYRLEGGFNFPSMDSIINLIAKVIGSTLEVQRLIEEDLLEKMRPSDIQTSIMISTFPQYESDQIKLIESSLKQIEGIRTCLDKKKIETSSFQILQDDLKRLKIKNKTIAVWENKWIENTLIEGVTLDNLIQTYTHWARDSCKARDSIQPYLDLLSEIERKIMEDDFSEFSRTYLSLVDKLDYTIVLSLLICTSNSFDEYCRSLTRTDKYSKIQKEELLNTLELMFRSKYLTTICRGCERNIKFVCESADEKANMCRQTQQKLR